MNPSGKPITREELYEAVWSKPIKTLAQEWNTTYPQIVGACEQMSVPRPGHGYWQLIARGFQIDRDPLPDLVQGIAAEALLYPVGVRHEKPPAIALNSDSGARPDTAVGKASEESATEPDNSAQRPNLGPTLENAVDDAVLDVLRQATQIDFWQDTHSSWVLITDLPEWLSMPEGSKSTPSALIAAVKKARSDYRTFQTIITEGSGDRGPRLQITIRLRPEFEWNQAIQEAWSFKEAPNLYGLSDNALRLYTWAKGPKNTGQEMKRQRIGAQSRLVKTYSDIYDHLLEIRLKADPTIQWEGNPWHGPLRIWFGKEKLVYYHFGPLNPELHLNARQPSHEEMSRFKLWLYEEIQKPGFPDSSEYVGIFDFQDRKTFASVFSGVPDECGSYGPLPQFFNNIRLTDGLQLSYRFEKGQPWLLVCRVKEGFTWRRIKANLAEKARAIPLEKRYSLSPSSMALLKWIDELKSDEYLLGMTPPVEDQLEREIGIELALKKENLAPCIQLMVDEINDSTDFNLRTIPWKHYSEQLTRILVKRKRPEIESVVRAIQGLGLCNNKALDAKVVKAAIESLISPP